MQNFNLIQQKEESGPLVPEGETSLLYLYMIVLVAAVGGFLFGYEIQLISGAIIFLEKEFTLTPFWYGAVMGSAILGCPFGPLAGLWLADRLGRRKTLILSSVAFLVSAVGCALAGNRFQFILWRFVGGIGIGLAATVSPMYIAEVAPARLRGRLVLVNQLAIVIGGTLSAAVAYLLSDGGHWRWMFASQAVPIFWLMIGLVFVPESPRWLAMMGRNGNALSVLAKINGPSQAERDLSEIRTELGDERGDLAELFQPGVRRALVIGIVLMVFSQICGATIIHMYAPTLFVATGISTESDAILNNIYICCWATLCTAASFGVVRALGRRPIIIYGSIAMAVGHLLLFLCFMCHAPNVLTLAAMMLTSASFTLSLAPLSWVVLSEIFPNRVRGKAMSLATVIMFASSYIAVNLFPPVMSWFKERYGHAGGAFLIFLCICLCCALFVWRMLPETKDKTLEEIGEFWLKRRRDLQTNPAEDRQA
jgi:sugar porter (SP) family MFS transporter